MGRRLLDMVLSALGAVIAVWLAYAGSWLAAFGPQAVSDSWFGTALIAGLWLNALVIMVFGAARNVADNWSSWLVMIVGIVALGLALMAVQSVVENRAFQERGRLATCTIVKVDERTETRTDANGDTTTTTYYHHRLRCAGVRVPTMTTGKPAGRAGTQLRVEYDPTGRLGPRPAADRTDDAANRWLLAVGLAVAATIRGGMELRGRPGLGGFFFEPRRGLRRIPWGLTLFLAGMVAVAALVGTYHLMRVVVDGVLGLVGVPPHLVRSGWLRWPTGVLVALAGNYLLDLVRRIAVAVIRRFGWLLDPSGELRQILQDVELDVGFNLGVFGLQVSFDGGFLGYVKGVVTAWWRRRRARTRVSRIRRRGTSPTP